jgi:hypothetical protein
MAPVVAVAMGNLNKATEALKPPSENIVAVLPFPTYLFTAGVEVVFIFT